jgi:hypothetical protein
MLNAFDKKKYLLEDYEEDKEPFDKRSKQIEAIRKNRLLQLEKAKKAAENNLDESSKSLNNSRRNIIQEVLYYALIEPIIEQKFLFMDSNVPGLTRWVDEVKQIKQKIEQTYSSHQTHISDWNAQKQQLEQAKKECQAMLIQTEKLALLETLYNENGGI